MSEGQTTLLEPLSEWAVVARPHPASLFSSFSLIFSLFFFSQLVFSHYKEQNISDCLHLLPQGPSTWSGHKGFCWSWLGTSAILAVPAVYQKSLENYKVPSCQMIAVFTHILCGVYSVVCHNISFMAGGGAGGVAGSKWPSKASLWGTIRSQTSKFSTLLFYRMQFVLNSRFLTASVRFLIHRKQLIV